MLPQRVLHTQFLRRTAHSSRALAFDTITSLRLAWRSFSVVAWGRNTEGQCGTSQAPVLCEPTLVDALDGASVASLAVGRLHSGAVLHNGEAWTWGEGRSGKLGQGTAEDVNRPARVEALVGRADITAAALGHNHSLFLARDGSVWSCGENKEGQCGLGTTLEVLAQQRRQEWGIGATYGGAQAEGGELGMQSHSYNSGSSAWLSGAGNPYIKPFLPHGQRQHELDEARRMYEGATRMRALNLESDFGFMTATAPGSSALRSYESAFGGRNGLMPGQSHTPTRIGRDLHPLLSGNAAGEGGGIEGEVVTGIAATKYFSVLSTASGGVWTFGGSFNGALGHDASWVTSARQVGGAVTEAIEDNGGAVKVEAGSTFCVCLTRSGRVLVWGNLPGEAPPQGAVQEGGVTVAEVMGLPRITDVAAGHAHAVMTDGERVWSMGHWLNPGGGAKPGSGWGSPLEVLQLQGEGITCVSAGAHAAAAVSGTGRVWLWGRLLAEENGRALQEQSAAEAGLENWAWAGMGSAVPQVVPGLSDVQSIALGPMHALALVKSEAASPPAPGAGVLQSWISV